MSPITYAHRCKTPTLLIQHDNDLRCPVEQSEQFYAVLKDAGCEVEMLRMPGTPHAGSVIGPLEIRHARSEALLDWFKKYV
jgi:dipeptidyl aminopeptidase/acylaminoacyl peptidase